MTAGIPEQLIHTKFPGLMDSPRPDTTAGMLAEFLDRRGKSIALLEGLSLKDLWRTGRHSEFGRITIIRQVGYLVYHEQTHLPEIEALRQQFT